MRRRMYIQLSGRHFEQTEIRSGYQLSPTFGAWQDQSAYSHPWRVTHLPSGNGVCQCESLRLAAQCAEEFEARTDLTEVTDVDHLTYDRRMQGKAVRDDLVARGLCIKFVDLYQ